MGSRLQTVVVESRQNAETVDADSFEHAQIEGAGSRSRPRVLFMNRSYWPDVEATGQLLTQLTRGLADQFEVHVLCGQPNHVTGETAAESAAPRVEIHRVSHTTFSKSSFAGRLLNLLTFSVSAWQYGRRLNGFDVVVCESDPFFLPLVGSRLAKRQRARFIVYLQDLYPDIAIAVGKIRESFISRRIRGLLKQVYEQADEIVTLSESMVKRLRSWGIRDVPATIIPNWYDESLCWPEPSAELRAKSGFDPNEFVVMYSGNMGMAHVLDPIIGAATKIEKSLPDVKFVFVGGGVRKPGLEEQVAERNLSNVEFRDYVPLEQLGESLTSADVQLISLQAESAGCVMPSKLYGCLASGRPIVAICPDESELAGIVRQSESGIVCDTSVSNEATVDAIVGALRRLRNDADAAATLGTNGRSYATENFRCSTSIERFSDVLNYVLQRQS